MESQAFMSQRAAPLGHPYRYISSELRRVVAEMVAQVGLPAGPQVLDFGCGAQPYRTLFPLSGYVGADLPGNPSAVIQIQPDGSLPVPAASFDLVLSTQVLEHVVSPAHYLSECSRVLRAGGHLALTTHGLMLYHRDPVDYWRWTHEGLRRIVTEAGLRVERFEGLMGVSAVALQLLQDATLPRLPKVLAAPYAALMQALVALFDKCHSPASRAQNALVFALTARKI